MFQGLLFSNAKLSALLVGAAIALSACGAGSGVNSGGGVDLTSVPNAPAPTLDFSTKTAELSWPSVSGASHYKVFETPAAGQSPVLLGTVTVPQFSQPLALYKKLNARYSISACNATGCSAPSGELAVGSNLAKLSKAIGYFKASNTKSDDLFGWSVALSGDGNTLAVGAYAEDSATTVINGDESNTNARDSGAVYVFSRSVNATNNSSTWTQQAYLKASNAESFDTFGDSISLSADGNTLAVGASGEGSAGLNAGPTDNSAPFSGAVYVFSRTAATSTWVQQAYLKASNAEANDLFGWAIALAADGSTLAVGARLEDSAGTSAGPSDNSAQDSGAVYVFNRAANASTWVEQAYLKASNAEASDFFGYAIALSADGSTLAVGAHLEDSAGTSAGPSDNSAQDSGAVYVFNRAANASTWTQQAYLKASNAGSGDEFGWAIALSADGTTLAVGADAEDSAATGINGDQTNESPDGSGAVYVFSRAANASTWTQQAYIKASNTTGFDPDGGDFFGYAVALSADGNTLAVGAPFEDSTATGINGNQSNVGPHFTETGAGAVYVFSRAVNTGTWTQQAYVKASNTGTNDLFGNSVALSGDANTLAVGAYLEGSAATRINGNQSDNSAPNGGAVYLY